MREFEVVMDSGIAYVSGDGIRVEDGFACIYEEVEVEMQTFNPIPYIAGADTKKVIERKTIHIFDADSVISVTEVEDEEMSEDVKVFVTMNNICEEKIEDVVKKELKEVKLLGDRVDLIGKYDNVDKAKLDDVFMQDVREMGLNAITQKSAYARLYNPSGNASIESIKIGDSESSRVAEVSATEYGVMETSEIGMKTLSADDRTKLLTLMYEYNKVKTLNKQ